MSGGHFEYNQYRFADIADEIERVISANGVEKTPEQVKRDFPWVDVTNETEFEWYKYDYNYPEEVVNELKKGVDMIRKAQIYAHRIDWLLSDDDGEDTFLRKLKEELKEYDKRIKRRK